MEGDYGDRANRKHARMKYTILDHGLEWYVSTCHYSCLVLACLLIHRFKEEVEKKLGYSLEGPRPTPKFTTNGDNYSWTKSLDGSYCKTLYIEGGRVRDTPSYQLRSALRELATVHTGDFRFTGTTLLLLI